METLYLWSPKKSDSMIVDYVDSDIFCDEGILKVVNLVNQIDSDKFTPKITNQLTKKIRVLDYNDDSYNLNNTNDYNTDNYNTDDEDDNDNDDDDVHNCHIIEGENWKITHIEELGIILETTYGLQVAVHTKGCHPCVICPDFRFCNSDGSTDWIHLGKQYLTEDIYPENITMRDIHDIIYHLKNRILEYCFNQIH